jgi:uncharacterized protein (DUF302 family)
VSGAAGHAFLNENQTTTCSRSRAQLRLTSKGSLMPDTTQSSDGVITKPSSKSVAQTIDGLRRLIVDRGFTVFNVIDHSGVAERAGVQMPDSKLVMFGKPAVGAAVMLAAPLAALDIPLKVLVWGDHSGRCFGARKQHRTGSLLAEVDRSVSRLGMVYRAVFGNVLAITNVSPQLPPGSTCPGVDEGQLVQNPDETRHSIPTRLPPSSHARSTTRGRRQRHPLFDVEGRADRSRARA